MLVFRLSRVIRGPVSAMALLLRFGFDLYCRPAFLNFWRDLCLRFLRFRGPLRHLSSGPLRRLCYNRAPAREFHPLRFPFVPPASGFLRQILVGDFRLLLFPSPSSLAAFFALFVRASRR